MDLLAMLPHLVSGSKTYAASEQVSVAAQVATTSGAVGSVVSVHLSLPEEAALVSVTVAVLGFFVQVMLAIRVFYKDAQERREDREATARERALAQQERARAQVAREEGASDRAKIVRAVEKGGP